LASHRTFFRKAPDRVPPAVCRGHGTSRNCGGDGMTEGGVRVRLFRAIRSVRKSMGDSHEMKTNSKTRWLRFTVRSASQAISMRSSRSSARPGAAEVSVVPGEGRGGSKRLWLPPYSLDEAKLAGQIDRVPQDRAELENATEECCSGSHGSHAGTVEEDAEIALSVAPSL
jgi:hypothetical protein